MRTLKKLMLLVVALVAVVALSCSAEAAQKKKQQKQPQNVVWQIGFNMPGVPGPDNFRVLGEFGTKEECTSELTPDMGDAYTDDYKEYLAPGEKITVYCRPDYF